MKAVITRRTTIDDLPEFVRVEDVATLLGISRASAYAAVKRGEIPSITIGRTIRVPREALKAMAQQKGAAA